MRVEGFGFRVSGFGFRVSGFGFRVFRGLCGGAWDVRRGPGFGGLGFGFGGLGV